jgi:hypothetical protein
MHAKYATGQQQIPYTQHTHTHAHTLENVTCTLTGGLGGDGEGGEGGMGSGMVDMIMRQLLSKDVLYTPLKASRIRS